MFRVGNNTDIKALAIFICFFTIIRIIKFVPTMPASVYFFLWIICAIFILLHHPKKTNLSVLLFIFFCFFSIIPNEIDTKYNVWLRFFGFIIIVVSIGPLFDNKWLYLLKKTCYNYASVVLVGVTLVSFIIFCVKPALMLTIRGNLYGGITIHSMQMSPIAGIAATYSLCSLMPKLPKSNIINKCTSITCVFICVISCLLAGSRSALIAMFISCFTYLYLKYRHNKRVFTKIIIILFILVTITSPIWMTYTEVVQAKMEISEAKGGMLTARSSSWGERISEFKENPIFGIGFATVNDSSYSNHGDGIVEPGNGWLFVLSSTGILSFFTFVYIYMKFCLRLIKIKTNESFLIVSVLVFLAVHLNAEGYTLSSGIYLFFYLWLTLGYANSLINNYSERSKRSTLTSNCKDHCAHSHLLT